MKPGLAVGGVKSITVTVDEQSQASLLGGPVHPLYGTAGMIAHMEWAARQHILPYLEEDEEGVGYQVNVMHLAPAPIGATVCLKSTVTALEPKRVTSQVEAWWNDTQIGSGSIVQALVSREKLYACLQSEAPQKPAQVAELKGNSGKTLHFKILKWEHEFSACTRYDEWLICRLETETFQHEGAFLLRYEIEEWQEKLQALVENQLTTYESDFLEPLLKLKMQRTSEGFIGFDIQMQTSDFQAAWQAECSQDQALSFVQDINRLLGDFPSLL